MNRALPKSDPDAPVILLDIGNTNIAIATGEGENLKAPLQVPTGDDSQFRQVWDAHAKSLPKERPAATVIASVVPRALEEVLRFVFETTGKEPLVVGENLDLPMDVEVEDRRAVGVDRVCSAAAVYERLQTACTVITFGTAITVDLVDEEGTFQGGAILPGMRMQLRALREYTAGLPEAPPGFPNTVHGRNTIEAIQNGVCRGIIGAVRGIVEGYATFLNRWPQTVASGGDAEFMAPKCDFIDTLVTHLALRGVGLAYRKHLAALGV